MKTKSIILSGLLLIGLGAATTSCEDMFTPDNEHVTTDLAPQDTVYQVMGIVGKMQHLVDRTILLGEVRADLVDVADNADKNLQDLANHVAGLDNAYNNPQDYYAVINSCNIYLENVNDSLKTYGEYKFKKEIIAVKTFRAWAYLELAKIYGNVPLILEPIISSNAAEEAVNSTANRADMVKICDTFIEDLAPYAYENENNALRPSYGKTDVPSYFIPVRVMLGELCLWRGSFTGSKNDFINAARYYHNFLTFPNEERAVTSSNTQWGSTDFTMVVSGYASTNFKKNIGETVMYVPMDTAQYFGTFSELKGLYSSLFENDYYPSIVPSTRLREISQGPTYCYPMKDNNDMLTDPVYAPRDVADLEMNNPLAIGDLRLFDVYKTESVTDKYNADYSTNRQVIAKFANGVIRPGNLSDIPEDYVTLFRVSTIYLHMAEALNRAGFPETAFAILKYGLADEILTSTSIVSAEEYAELQKIESYGFPGNFTMWDKEVFMSDYYRALNPTEGTGVSYKTQRGIHDLGSGASYINEHYIIPVDTLGVGRPPYSVEDMAGLFNGIYAWPEEPTAEDSLKFVADSTEYMNDYTQYYSDWYEVNTPTRIAQVDSLILEEMALENSFEGQRYYDLMRYSKYNEVGEYGNPSKAKYLDKCVGMRKGKENAENIVLDSWYLPLRNR